MTGRAIRVAAILALAAGAAGCGSPRSGGGEGGNVFSNLLMYGGTTVPPVAPTPLLEVADCPPVTVSDGGAAIRAISGSGDAASVRSQLSITEVARECIGREDGAVLVKVGVQVRALLGPGGSAARFDNPVTIVLKRGEQVLASQTRRVSIAIPPGQFQENGVVVVDGLVVPPNTGEFDIEVGLGGGAAAPTRRRRS